MSLSSKRGGNLDQSRKEIQAVLHALQHGVVPENILSFGIGRTQEMEELQSVLQHIGSGSGMVKFISGEYGSGKSFMLQTIQERAWSQNFVVAKMQVEKGLRLNQFHSLYYHIMHSLTTRDSGYQGTSFKDLFNHWLETLKKDTSKENASESIQQVISTLNQYNLSFSRALLYYIRARIQNDQTMADSVASWLTGEQNIPYALKKKFEVIGHIDHSNAIHFLQAFVKLIKCLGYEGLVILVDELELVIHERSDLRLLVYQNLRYLIDNCFNDQLNHCLFFFAATNDWFNDKEKGPESYSALSQRLGKGDERRTLGKSNMRKPVIRLTRPNAEDLRQLTEKIIKLYSYAHHFELKISQESLQNWVSLMLKEDGIEEHEINIRIYVTKLIDILDLLEMNPNNKMFNTELKAVSYGKTNSFVQTLGSKKNS